VFINYCTKGMQDGSDVHVTCAIARAADAAKKDQSISSVNCMTICQAVSIEHQLLPATDGCDSQFLITLLLSANCCESRIRTERMTY